MLCKYDHYKGFTLSWTINQWFVTLLLNVNKYYIKIFFGLLILYNLHTTRHYQCEWIKAYIYYIHKFSEMILFQFCSRIKWDGDIVYFEIKVIWCSVHDIIMFASLILIMASCGHKSFIKIIRKAQIQICWPLNLWILKTFKS